MNTEDRRRAILEILESQSGPISGAKLAERLGVSRQVIVQDMALIKASGKEVISTIRGYLLPEVQIIQKQIDVDHERDRMEAELLAIVDHGGLVVNTGIDHPIYGKITVDMNLKSRKDVQDFMAKTEIPAFAPLSDLTCGKHFHLIEAQTEADMEAVEGALKDLGICI